MTSTSEQVANDLLFPDEVCIHDLFEVQAARHADAHALAIGDDTLTYGELNRRANRIARILRARGIGPDNPVAVYTQRSFNTITAILGILKAGGAYLTLDPAYPADRLAYMLGDSGTSMILTDRQLVDTLPVTGASIECMDTLLEPPDEEDDRNPRFEVTPQNLAYLIYTSGSTGKPKGVLVTHRNLVHSTRARIQYYRERISSFLLLSSFTFDSSVAGIFWTLCSGGTLVIADETLLHNPAGIVEAIRGHRVSHLLTVPSLYALILDELQMVESTGLRAVIVAGETCPKRLVQRHRTALPNTAMHNEYGPTEVTVWCTVFDCRGEIADIRVPIGKPIVDTQLYILDDELQPVPAGSPGELYVGGRGVTQGYLNRPDVTREKFLPDPFLPREAGRLYRTGDLARFLPDGNLDFLGRVDQQVKIRGFRVELGEIEATLLAHPDVDAAVVTTREATSGMVRLLAYVTPRRSPAPTSSMLQAFLRRKLPDYMIPTAFVMLRAFPLLPNGKIDRGAMPVPHDGRPQSTRAFVAPRNPREQQLAAIWANVLGLEEVGIEDRFFELGGDSLLSMQIVARARQEGLRFTSELIAQYPTIAELAHHIKVDHSPLAVETGTVAGPVPVTPRQWEYFEEDHQTGGWIERTAVDVLEPIHPAILEQALKFVVAHHDALRTRFAFPGPGPEPRGMCLAVEEHPLMTSIDATGLLGNAWGAALDRAQQQARIRIDVSAGPLLQLAYVHRLRRTSRMFMFIHHLVVDAYSIPILLEDLERSCLQLSHSELPRLPVKTTSYKEWSERLGRWADSSELRGELEYWLAHSRPTERPLPMDIEEPQADRGLLRYVSDELTQEETRALLHAGSYLHGVQINTILLVALVHGFSAWTGTRTLRINVNTHGREPIFNDVDLSRTVGWFSHQFPILLDLDAMNDPIHGLHRVHEQLQLVPNGGIGYGVLRYLSRDPYVRRTLNDAARPEVGLNYHGRTDGLLADSSLFRLHTRREVEPPSQVVPVSRRIPVSSRVSEGKLSLRFRYHEQAYRPETIEQVVESTMATLRVIAKISAA